MLIRTETQPAAKRETPAESSHDPIVSGAFTLAFIQIKARQLCRQGDFSVSDHDDITQGMQLHLLKQSSHFDPLRGNPEAFITQMLKAWVAMELRHRKRRKRRQSFKAVSLESTPVKSETDITTLGAVLLEEDGRRLAQVDLLSPIEDIDLCEATEHAVRHLDPEDRTLLDHVAEHGVASTARAFRISRRQVLNALARAREHFENAGLGWD